ncbi:MAG: hypothetical protein GXX96_29915 [Planctomycetaceae bacterium]|nr:hypothetical protein [Planctomycetaceae bacterium]
MPIANPLHSKGNDCDQDISNSRWLRTTNGTFEIRYRPKDHDYEYVRIASHGICIKTVLFVISQRETRIRYTLEFLTPDGTPCQIIQHEDLADEQAFFKVALPGFTLSANSRSFALLRECLMEDLPGASFEAILTTLGWYVWQGKYVFAHAGGIISADSACWESELDDPSGTPQLLDVIDIDKACSDVPILAGQHRPISAVHVRVPEQLAGYRPDPPKTQEEARSSVRAVLELLALGDPNVTYVAVPALFAAAIQDPRVAIFLYGESGSMKTEFALLLLSFFIPNAQERDCASFKSTENALRALFSSSGNVPIVIDDYIQLPGSRNGGDEAKKAENLIRSVVNRTGKDRCAGDGSLRPIDRPRGLPIITGEILPDGLESLRRRTINLPVDKGTFEAAIQGTRPNRFDHFQALARQGTLAQAMGAFIAWVAGRLPDHRDFLEEPGHDIVPDYPTHLRLLEATEYILSGSVAMLEFAREIGACSDAECERHDSLAIDAASNILDRAYFESLEDSPTEAFGQLVQAALSSLRCHIEVMDIDNHKDWEYAIPLELLGYTEREVAVTDLSNESGDEEACLDQIGSPEAAVNTVVEKSAAEASCDLNHATSKGADRNGSKYVEHENVYRPHGKRVGWLHGIHIDLIPEAALAEANSMAGRAGMLSLPGKKAFGKMLASQNWIATRNKDRNTLKVRRGNIVHEVWRIHCLRLFETALRWSAFDVEGYRQMSRVERQHAAADRRETILAQLRTKVVDFQVEHLLNPVLTETDRKAVLTPAPPQLDEDSATTESCEKRYTPAPLPYRPLPGYDEPDKDEDGMDS